MKPKVPAPQKASTVPKVLGHIILYGSSGTGKTFFSTRAPGKNLLLDLDNGMMSGRDTETDYIPRSELPDYDAVVETLEYYWNSGKYDNITLDSFTQFSDMTLAKVCKTAGVSKPRIQDYGEQINLLTDLIDQLTLSVPTPRLICICHEDVLVNEEFGGIRYRPLIIGRKFPSMVPRFFGENWRLVRKPTGLGSSAKLKYILQTQAGTDFDAKSRAGLPSELVADWSVVTKNLDALGVAMRGGE